MAPYGTAGDATGDISPVAAIDIRPYRIRSMIRWRELRARHFPRELFADVAWDILLDLALAHVRGRPMAQAELRCSAVLPAASVRSWIDALAQAGLLSENAAGLSLSDRGWRAFEVYLSEASAASS